MACLLTAAPTRRARTTRQVPATCFVLLHRGSHCPHSTDEETEAYTRPWLHSGGVKNPGLMDSQAGLLNTMLSASPCALEARTPSTSRWPAQDTQAPGECRPWPQLGRISLWSSCVLVPLSFEILESLNGTRTRNGVGQCAHAEARRGQGYEEPSQAPSELGSSPRAPPGGVRLSLIHI